jgi:hypothetical protein
MGETTIPYHHCSTVYYIHHELYFSYYVLYAESRKMNVYYFSAFSILIFCTVTQKNKINYVLYLYVYFEREREIDKINNCFFKNAKH